MSWRIGSALQLVQMQATLARADQGAGNSRVRLYTTPRPAVLGAHADTPQSEIVLADPCGAIVGGELSLAPSAAGMVMHTGLPRWGEWIAADGSLLADGSVTDMDGDGDFQVTGGATPEGESSPLLYAGGLVVLVSTHLA